MTKFIIPFLAVSISNAAIAEEPSQNGWINLFDGESLEGWNIKSGFATYRVENGAIVGKTAEGSGNSFLTNGKSYADFELEFEVKVDSALNSGVQIRSKLKNVDKDKHGGRFYGPQVEIEASGANGAEAGYVYGEATGRGWLTPKERLIAHKHFKDDQWNRFRIVASRARIQTWINDNMIENLTDTDIYQAHSAGLIGFQVHGIKKGTGPYEVAWKNIRIKELQAPAETTTAGTSKTLFDGSSLDHWMAGNGAEPKWVIEDGSLARVKKGGYIWTREAYSDFALDLEVKVSPGCNSGVFFRTDPKNPVQGGFEIQIMDSAGKDKIGKHDAGALYDAKVAATNAIHPAGQWNNLHLEARGSKLIVDLNGKRIQDLDLSDWKKANANPDGSKNKFITALADLPQKGHIGFQDHGHPVWFRNVVLTPLD
ncbi:MAG: DUF1080 domain-containing protein [Verrucomicrobiales bacterium]|nr:DUF1080 domain-containing protein [Verrucomicrobiales bacterium]